MTVKTLYFGRVNPGDSVKDTFENYGSHYYYSIEFDEADICIKDTCGRALPIDQESLGDLISALNYIYKYNKTQQTAKEWAARSIKELNALYGLVKNV